MRPRQMFMLATALGLATPPLLLAQQFEGVIKQRSITVSMGVLEELGFDVSEAMFDVPVERLLALQDELGPEDMTVADEEIYIKGSLVRADASDMEGEGYVIIDMDQGVWRMVQPDKQMYIEMTAADLERMRGMMAGMGPEDEGEGEKPEARDTGLTKTINGMACKAYDVETEEGTTRVWVSQDDVWVSQDDGDLVSSFARFSDKIRQMTFMGDDELDPSMIVAQHGFPVLVQTLPHDTYSMYEVEVVVSVERRPVPDEMFAIPAGLQKRTMAEMMQGPGR